MTATDQEFQHRAAGSQREIERVLARRGLRLAQRRRFSDPHLRELLQKLWTEIDEARCIYDAARERSPGTDHDAAFRRIERHLEELCVQNIDRDAAAELFDALDRALVASGDRAYVQRQVALEQSDPDEKPTWVSMFGAKEAKPDGHAVDLSTLRWVQATYQRRTWTRLQMRKRAVLALAAVLWTLVGVLGVGLGAAGLGWRDALLAGAAGALGSAVSGTYKLRDQIVRSRDIRLFTVSLAAQIGIGASAGLFALLVIESGVISLGGSGSRGLGAVAFVLGFSEPFFLGVVNHVAKLQN